MQLIYSLLAEQFQNFHYLIDLKLSLVATYFTTLFVKMDALSDVFGSN